MIKKNWAHTAFVVLIIALIGLSIFILASYGTAIIFGLILAFVIHPLYTALNKTFKRPTLTALVVSVLFVLAITVPLILVSQHLATDLNNVYGSIRNGFDVNLIPADCSDDNGILCKTLNVITTYIDQDELRAYAGQAASVIVTFLSANLRKVLLSIPAVALNIGIMLIVLFYTLRDGSGWLSSLQTALPLAKRHTNKLFKYTGDTLNAILYGQIITSLVQGILGGIGFWIFGVSNPIFWAIIMSFLSVFPLIGAWLVWGPAVIVLLISGKTGAAIGLAIYSGIFVSLSDNLLRPLIVAGKADIHPLAVLLGVFGGLAVFGIIGFVLGPLIIALTISLATSYHSEFHKMSK